MAALLLPFVPFASADGCVAEDAATVTDGPIYVTADGHLYQESGQNHGLQRNAGSAEGDDGRSCSWDADTLVI